ncbi:SMP-30/gluconolactonase/LRE family protein [Micromonospora sp. CPCC 206061]|uniref:SMP-30/gluconolactonase/LRE family protein n=1 Tax=Micromonospora sp. CPCC 206061 TaxID=3122410 RepID=UPI002FF2FB3D
MMRLLALAVTVTVTSPLLTADAEYQPARSAYAAPAPCLPGGTYGDPLPAASVSAVRVPGRFNFLEGPVWIAEDGRLLVSDMQPAAGPEGVQPSLIRALTPPDRFDVFVAGSGSNGLALSTDGRHVLAATHDQRSLSSYDLAGGARDVVVQTFQGLRFNSPNDLTVRGDGTVYFTDPSFQRGDRADEMAGRTGIFRVSGDEVFLVDDTVAQPNGIVLSPDGNTLYVGGNSAGRIYRYPVFTDGTTGPRTEFAALSGPDGATIDCAGNLYWASYVDGKVHVFAPDGRALGTISAGRNTTNAAFGGADGRTLFITSGTWGDFGVYQIELNVPGWPY